MGKDHRQQAANRVGRKEGSPTSGKASPGSHLGGGGRAEVVLELRTSGKEGEGKGGTRLYLYIKAESLSHSFNKHVFRAYSVQ